MPSRRESVRSTFVESATRVVIAGIIAATVLVLARQYLPSLLSGSDNASAGANSGNDRDSEAQSELDAVKNEVANVRKELELLQEQRQVVDLARTTAKKRLSEERALANDIELNLKLLTTEVAHWETDFSELMTNDVGKRVAAAAPDLKTIISLTEGKRPDKSQLTAWQTDLTKLRSPLEELAENVTPGLVIPEEYQQLLRALAKSVSDALDKVRQDQELLDQVVKDASNRDPGQLTLHAALEQKQEAERRERAQRLARVSEQTREAENKKLEEAEKKRIEAKGEVERQKIVNDTLRLQRENADLKARSAAEKKEFEAAQAKAKLMGEMDADMKQIRSLLSAFIEPGYSQVVGKAQFATTIDKQPMSLSQLRGIGALDSGMDGLKELHRAAGHNKNKRRVGSLQEYRSTKDVEDSDSLRERLQQAQDLLNKYGPLLVERGLLLE